MHGAYGVAAAQELVELSVPGQHRVGTPEFCRDNNLLLLRHGISS